MSVQPSGYMGREQYPGGPARLVPASKLGDRWAMVSGPDIHGWEVRGRDDRRLGVIDDVLVDTSTGRAEYAILSYGGVLGMGARRTLLPIDLLEFDEPNRRLRCPVTEDAMKDAPDYADDVTDFGQFSNYWRDRATQQAKPDRPAGQVVPAAPSVMEEKAAPAATRPPDQAAEAEAYREAKATEGTMQKPGRRTRIRIVQSNVVPGQEGQAGDQAMGEGDVIRVPTSEGEVVIERKAAAAGEIIIEQEVLEEEQDVTDENKGARAA